MQYSFDMFQSTYSCDVSFVLFTIKFLHMDLMLFNPSTIRGQKIWDEGPTEKFDN